MTTFTEGAHACEFILSEASGSRSRENGTLLSGEDLAAGTVLQDNGAGKLIAFDGDTLTDGSLADEAVGILLYPGDATAGDLAVSYLARDAEVNL
ncbi:MAG: head decoration protein, partial [Mesorhizobium sp.]